MRIMVVDDEQLILEGLVDVLQKQTVFSCEVLGASDAIEALEKLERFAADLILTDIQMPEMTGLDFIKKAKEEQLCNDFIILSGYNEFDYAVEALRYQVCDYLLKPIHEETLIETIRRALSKKALPEERRLLQSDTRQVPSSIASLLSIKTDTCSRAVQNVVGFIQEHYHEDISLDQLADDLQLHPSYLCSLFKLETGVTFLYYLHAARVNKAAALLLHEPSMKLNDICRVTGFSNERNFYKVFKKYTGTTPGQFREQYGS